MDRELGVERRRAAEVGDRADAAHLNGEADQPVGEHADAVHHEVHHHGVVGVLGAAEPGFDDREAGLHEHDQEAADQRPDEVDGDPVLARPVHEVGDRQPAFESDTVTSDAVPVRPPSGSPLARSSALGVFDAGQIGRRDRRCGCAVPCGAGAAPPAPGPNAGRHDHRAPAIAKPISRPFALFVVIPAPLSHSAPLSVHVVQSCSAGRVDRAISASSTAVFW